MRLTQYEKQCAYVSGAIVYGKTDLFPYMSLPDNNSRPARAKVLATLATDAESPNSNRSRAKFIIYSRVKLQALIV
jgi:hypothetical protein